jgi:hypothetical protein
MTNPIGPITPADEGFCHQIADTFAVVGTSDLGWTEKVCAMAMARDGTIQLGFGLGKYTNRNVIDAYAGVSRGVEQTTVRASRRLEPEPELAIIGPIRYTVIEPLRQVRFVLEPNEVQPIAFDWLFQGAFPPQFEHRNHTRSGYRVSADLVRYHQIGLCSGWLEINGQRIEISPDTWVSTRDHSWGVRYGIGQPLHDLEPLPPVGEAGSYHFFWTPSYLERRDGTPYGIFMVFNHFRRPGMDSKVVWGTIEHPGGRVERMVDIRPELSYDPSNRRLRGGHVHCSMADGTTRTLQVEVLSDTGFHLGAGLYFGFEGHHHGEWRGTLNVDGERIDDCSTFDNARRLHQIRDTVVRVTDPVGGGVGYGNWQPIAAGAIPELDLDAATSFM